MSTESHPITLDGFTFAGYGTTEIPSADLTSLICTGLDGWAGAPARRTAHTDRPGADGAFRGDAYRGVRTISLDGMYYAQSYLDLRRLERRLAGICADPTRLYPLTVADEVSPLTAYVELAGEVKLAGKGRRGVLSLALAAPDPRRFGPWVTSNLPTPVAGSGGVDSTSPGVVSTAPGVVSGTAPTPTTVTIANFGTGPAQLVAQFDGPATSPSILKTSTGDQVILGGSIPAGQPLWINLSAQHAHDVPGQTAGSYMYGRSVFGPGGYAGGGGLTVVNGVWPTLAAGEVATFLLTGGSSGALHMRPTFW